MGTKGEHQEILQIFLRSFDAHFFIAFLPFWAVSYRNFPPYFFAGIRATSCATFRPNTSVGNADRSRVCGDFFYDVVLRKNVKSFTLARIVR
jgi:hypothetical protein